MIAGRLGAIRKTEEAIPRTVKRLRRNASRAGEVLQPETLEYATSIIVFTTYAPCTFSAAVILQWYRVRGQVELAFKRFPSLASPRPRSLARTCVAEWGVAMANATAISSGERHVTEETPEV